jgi:hypothetical protein
MTDRELLEAAARAAGIDGALTWTPGATPWLRVSEHLARPWNPLTDDGDALRLAVKLGIDGWTLNVYLYSDEVAVYGPFENLLCKHQSDPYAATRRAIVRAAAACGTPMRDASSSEPDSASVNPAAALGAEAPRMGAVQTEQGDKP